MQHCSDTQIRPMRGDERSQVRALVRQSFHWFEQCWFAWTPHVLVADSGGKLLGGIVLKVFALPRDRTGGSISWVFTAPEARGLGLGQALVEAGLELLERHGCDQILAPVEGCNTSSSKLLATRGFGVLSPSGQLRRYGLRTFAVWAQISHYFELGYFLWVRPASRHNGSPVLQWWGTLVGNAVIGCLAWLHLDASPITAPMVGLVLPTILLGLLGLRYLGMKLMARQQGVQVCFRAWESGFPLSIAIALVFGGIYPVPGSLYPSTHQWRYREWLPHLGRLALAGTLPVLLLMGGIGTSLRLSIPSPDVAAWLDIALWLGKPFMLFDIALPFFPFTAFNGKRLWDWSRVVWGLMAIAAVVVWFL